jgi:hypothetical protein
MGLANPLLLLYVHSFLQPYNKKGRGTPLLFPPSIFPLFFQSKILELDNVFSSWANNSTIYEYFTVLAVTLTFDLNVANKKCQRYLDSRLLLAVSRLDSNQVHLSSLSYLASTVAR